MAPALDFRLALPQREMKDLLVVLLGWTGATHKNISKYSRMLNDAGFPTIAAAIPPLAVYSPTTAPHRRFAEQVLEFILQVAPTSSSQQGSDPGRAAQPALPQKLVLMAFSNGGAYPVEQIDELVRCDARYTELGSRIAAVIFDSAPCFINHYNSARALTEGKHIVLRVLFAATYCTAGVMLYTLLSPNRAQQFWENMLALSIGRKELILYSADDPLCDAAKLEKLIEARRGMGRAVEAHRWEESEHVGHLRRHPREYTDRVLAFLRSL